jgi:hypothetical protein
MKYEFCLNPLSLPAENSDKADAFLNDIFIGIAGLYNHKNTVTLYSNEKLNNTEIADSYTYKDYKIKLIQEGDKDLAEFVFEIEDRSPFLEIVSDMIIEELTQYEMDVFEIPANAAEYDILKFACLHEAVLISLPTNPIWQKEIIPVKLRNTKTYHTNEIDVLNIFDQHVSHLYSKADWKAELPNIVFSGKFEKWYKDLHEKNQLHVTNLIKRAHKLNFTGTIEQTKKIQGSNKNIWEWRGGCPAFGKGRIRILYKPEGEKYYILLGFIKTTEELTGEIQAAETALDHITSSIRK